MYLVSRRVPGVQMQELQSDDDRKVVEKELRRHVETLKTLRSDTPGVPGEELMVPPQRVCDIRWKLHSAWRPRSDVKGTLYFATTTWASTMFWLIPRRSRLRRLLTGSLGVFGRSGLSASFGRGGVTAMRSRGRKTIASGVGIGWWPTLTRWSRCPCPRWRTSSTTRARSRGGCLGRLRWLGRWVKGERKGVSQRAGRDLVWAARCEKFNRSYSAPLYKLVMCSGCGLEHRFVVYASST